MSTAYFDCFAGASGDMILGSLIDAGAPLDGVVAAVISLGIKGCELTTREVRKGSLRALAADVAVTDHTPRSPQDIEACITTAQLDPVVKDKALETFRLLAEAEARVHGVGVAEVHFHEVGAVDALVDVVGSCAALGLLGIDRVVVSPLATGRGTGHSEHGAIPIPGPAVTELLAGSGATLVERGEGELLTPTGAALLVAFADDFGPLPELRIEVVGYGAGKRDTELPNVLRVLVGAEERQTSSDRLLVETNVDDMSPELLPFAIERLLAAGAEDAWATPIVMKKGRAAVTVSVLCDRSKMEDVLDVLYAETSTLGTRIRTVQKDELQRAFRTVEVAGYDVRVKLGSRHGAVTTASPEYEDCAKVARITGLPLKEVYARAAQAARS